MPCSKKLYKYKNVIPLHCLMVKKYVTNYEFRRLKLIDVITRVHFYLRTTPMDHENMIIASLIIK